MENVRMLFSTVCDMSTTACMVILLVIIVRFLLKNAPRVFSYYLWVAVGFRLLCPISFSSALSIFNVGILKDYVVSGTTMSWSGTPDYKESGIFIWSAPKLTQPESVAENITAGNISAEPWIAVNKVTLLAFIWLMVCLIFLGYQIYSYIKLKKRLELAVKVEADVYECDTINEPFVMGFWKPWIYIPLRLKPSEREYILLHERHHIKRHDHQVKIIAVILLGIYWFNPLVWLAYYLMGKDMEMSCDEWVLGKLGNKIKEEYSNSLLDFAVDDKRWNLGTLAFGESSVKERVKNILKFKKSGKVILGISTVLCVLAVLIGISNGGNENAIRNISRAGSTGEFEYQLSDEIQSVLFYREFYFGTELSEYEVLQYGEIGTEGMERCGKFTFALSNLYDENEQWSVGLTAELNGSLADFLNMNYLEEQGFTGMGSSFYLENQSGWERFESGDDLVLAALNLDNGEGIVNLSCEYYQNEGKEWINTSGNAGVVLYHIVFSDKSVEELAADYEKPRDIEYIFEARNPYIGDHIADGHILRMLNMFSMGRFTTELQTSEEPYGIILHFEEAPEMAASFHAKMLQKAAIFLTLTENAGYFEWTYPGEDLNVTRRRYFTEDIESMLGISDLKAFAQKEETLEELLSEVKNSHWAEVEAGYVCGNILSGMRPFTRKEIITGRHPNAAGDCTYLVYSYEPVRFEEITTAIFGSQFPLEKEMYLVLQAD